MLLKIDYSGPQSTWKAVFEGYTLPISILTCDGGTGNGLIYGDPGCVFFAYRNLANAVIMAGS